MLGLENLMKWQRFFAALALLHLLLWCPLLIGSVQIGMLMIEHGLDSHNTIVRLQLRSLLTYLMVWNLGFVAALGSRKLRRLPQVKVLWFRRAWIVQGILIVYFMSRWIKIVIE